MSTGTDLQERQTSIFGELERAAHFPTGSVHLVGFQLTNPDMIYEDWEGIGRSLGEMRRWTNWALGDWYNFGDAIYGQPAAQASDPTRADRMDVLHRVTGLAPGTLANYSSICARISISVRRVELDFSVHEPVAALDPDDQARWLQKAIDEGWGRDELRQAIKDEKNPPKEGDDGVVVEKPLSIAERLEAAARLVYNQAQHTSDGSVLVPPEAWHQLAEALGEE